MKRPVGWIYWTLLGLLLLILGIDTVLSFLEAPPLKQGLVFLTVPLAIAAALLAHTFWGLERFRQLPLGLPEEERFQAVRHLRRRLWTLLAIAALPLGVWMPLAGMGMKSAACGSLGLQSKHLRLLGTRRLKGGEVAFDLALSVAHRNYARYDKAYLAGGGTLEGAVLSVEDLELKAPIPPGIRFTVKGSIPEGGKGKILHVNVRATLAREWDRWEGLRHVQGSETIDGTVETDLPVDLPP